MIGSNICYKLFFYQKKLEIILIEGGENMIIVEQVIQANLEDDYCFKLCHSLKIDCQIKDINSRHFSHLLVDSENYMHYYSRF